MLLERETALADAPIRVPARAGWRISLARFGRENPTAAAGALFLLLVVVAAIFAPVLSPHDPLTQSAGVHLRPPEGEHPFGTDNLGRDILSRVFWGARLSIYVSLLALVLGGATGIVVGMASGYLEGVFDAVAQRFVDTLLAFPTLILSLAMVGFLKPGAENIAIALGIVLAPRITRLIRGSVLITKRSDYVDAAHAVGCTSVRIMVRHILPNVVPYVIVYTSLYVGAAILAEASLSFLGVGVPPPAPSWGRMLSDASAQYLVQAPWMTVFPGLAISLTVLAANLLGDGLRDALDPKLRGRLANR
ncbi:MAG: ABC transporter permease [Chloroflexi bacterium]|nr:ABC transporter permease [Chloroflexota bacterium]